MAAHYLSVLRSFQPHGPYYLGGWCYGGIVAVEMAHQLLRLGEQVALLALLETVATPPSLMVPRYYCHRLGCVLHMKPSRWISYLKEKINYCRQTKLLNRNRFEQLKKPARGESEVEIEKLARLQHVYDANLKALKQYRSSPYPGRVTLFNAAELDPALIPDRYYGWVGLADEIEIYTVPGNHDSMLTEPHVSSLAEKLESCLQRAQMAENRV
jgi:thioesterase domain-containing protein